MDAIADKPERKKPKRKPSRRRRIVRWIVITGLLLLVVGTPSYIHLHYLRPEGTGPAGPAVPSQPFDKPSRKGKIVLLGIGDSITAGFGASKGHSFFERLVTNPENEFEEMKGLCLSAVFPNLEARNIAVSGSNSLQHANRIAKLPTYGDDILGIIVMTSGGNDIIHDYGRKPPREGAMCGATLEQAATWIENYRERLESMLLILKSRFPGGCHVFLGNIYDPSDGTGDIAGAIPPFVDVDVPDWPDGVAVLAAYNEIIARVADKYDFVHLVNLHDPFLGHGIDCKKFWKDTYRPEDPYCWYMIILEDPNNRGYDAIRRLFLLEMIRVFAKDN